MARFWTVVISLSISRALVKSAAAVVVGEVTRAVAVGVGTVGAGAVDAIVIELVCMKAETEQHIEVEGRVQTVLAGTMFRVELPNKHVVLATISGKMRKRFVRITAGDRVKMEMSPYDLDKARIIWRLG